MTSVRYSMSTVREVMELSEAGWSQRRIRQLLLEQHGSTPSLDTISRWLSPTYAERRRAMNRRGEQKQRHSRGLAFRLPGKHTAEYRCEFIWRLSQEGVPMTSIAKVCGIVLAVECSEHDVEQALLGKTPRSLRNGNGHA